MNLSQKALENRRAYTREYQRRLRCDPNTRVAFLAKNREAYRRRQQNLTVRKQRSAYCVAWSRARAVNPATWPRHILYRVKVRAKTLGLPFDLEATDIVVPEKCPVLNVPFVWGDGSTNPHQASIDRIVPELGYVKGNVRVISLLANRMKQNCTDPEVFRRLFEYVSGNLKDSFA